MIEWNEVSMVLSEEIYYHHGGFFNAWFAFEFISDEWQSNLEYS